jgi:hypothetical protein
LGKDEILDLSEQQLEQIFDLLFGFPEHHLSQGRLSVCPFVEFILLGIISHTPWALSGIGFWENSANREVKSAAAVYSSSSAERI